MLSAGKVKAVHEKNKIILTPDTYCLWMLLGNREKQIINSYLTTKCPKQKNQEGILVYLWKCEAEH